MNLAQPFNIGNTIPSRNYGAYRLAMIMRKWLSVHFKGKHILGSHRVIYGQASSESLFYFCFAYRFGLNIGSEEDNLFGAILDARLLKNSCQ